MSPIMWTVIVHTSLTQQNSQKNHSGQQPWPNRFPGRWFKGLIWCLRRNSADCAGVGGACPRGHGEHPQPRSAESTLPSAFHCECPSKGVCSLRIQRGPGTGCSSSIKLETAYLGIASPPFTIAAASSTKTSLMHESPSESSACEWCASAAPPS